MVRRNAATRTSSQSSNKLRRIITGCFSGGAEFLPSYFVTVLNKPGTTPTCRETTDSPEALAACRTSQSSLTWFTRRTSVLVTLAVPRCWARPGAGPGAPSFSPGVRSGMQHSGCALGQGLFHGLLSTAAVLLLDSPAPGSSAVQHSGHRTSVRLRGYFPALYCPPKPSGLSDLLLFSEFWARNFSLGTAVPGTRRALFEAALSWTILPWNRSAHSHLPLLGDSWGSVHCGSWERRRDSSGAFLWSGSRSSDCCCWPSEGLHRVDYLF